MAIGVVVMFMAVTQLNIFYLLWYLLYCCCDVVIKISDT